MTDLPQCVISKANFVSAGLGTPISGGAYSDVRDNWQTELAAADPTDHWRMGIPARNPISGLIAPGSFVLGDITDTAWQTLITALIGGTIKAVSPETIADATSMVKAIANVRARKRPRVGGTR